MMSGKPSCKTRCRQVVIFARAPRYGQVKTRLATDVGKLTALHFYRHNLKSLIQELRHGPWQLQVAVADFRDARHPLFTDLPTVVQQSGDLGHRMRGAFNGHRNQDCIIVGSDIPFIKKQHLRKAFRLLRRNHYVFGPATDGGYWLAGCRAGTRPHQKLMRHVRWSTAHALSDTLATLPAGRRFTLADTLFDVDNGESYHHFIKRSAPSINHL